MKRDEIEQLKHNARLDVRLPDQLRDEFLARCREEGVSSGAVIRSMIIDYVTAQPRRWSVMARPVKEAMMRRAKWIAGLGGGAVTAMAGAGLVLWSSATAEELSVDFDLQVSQDRGDVRETNRVASTVVLEAGQRRRFEAPEGDTAPQWAFEITVNRCTGEAENCPEGAIDIAMVIERLEDGSVVSQPRLVVLEGRQAVFEIQTGVESVYMEMTARGLSSEHEG